MNAQFRHTAWGLALLLPFIAAPAAFADTKAGVDAWARGDTATAIKEWQVAAEKGDPDAQFNMAQAYKMGRGVPQDLTKAEALYQKAATQGHVQAADFYGLLLFQRGEHTAAMPYIKAAADHGDPRAQYFLGLSLFNGDSIAKDWVRAYALVNLATQQGLPPAKAALAQMDQYIPIEQRQQAIAMSGDIAAQAEATRARQLASMDLGVKPVPAAAPAPVAAKPPVLAKPPILAKPPVMALPKPITVAVARPNPQPLPQTFPQPFPSAPARPLPTTKPVSPNQSGSILPGRLGSGAPLATGLPKPQPGQIYVPTPTATPKPPRPVMTKPAPAATVTTPAPMPAKPTMPSATSMAGGTWRVQLGAFGVASNADAMWNRVKNLPEIAGHARINAKAGAVTKLLAGGYSADGAQSACRKLAASGISCLATQ